MKRFKGFTLIELLIVVAIIAILAAIAVPNFLEAQTRSKVTRAKSDLRTLATAIEAYAVDNTRYPLDGHGTGDGHAYWYTPGGPTIPGSAGGLTSPIAYMTSVALLDPFRTQAAAANAKNTDAPDGNLFTVDDYKRFRYRNFWYTYTRNLNRPDLEEIFGIAYGGWQLSSAGPDQGFTTNTVTIPGTTGGVGLNVIYDPTNGTVSRGDIVRSQKFSDQPGPHGPGY